MYVETASPIPIDVVTVPDFSSTQRIAFTLRTLFFLASWEAFAPVARQNYRMHIAAIGEPPKAVRALAEEVGAYIHVFEPLHIGVCKSTNKLRGFEIPHESRIGQRILLLDTDIFFASDPSPYLEKINKDTIAAFPAMNKTLPEYYWKRIYKALQLPTPQQHEYIQTLKVELGLYEGPLVSGKWTHALDLNSIRPYWNSGVVLCPWHAELRSRWEHDLRTIFKLFAPPRNHLEKAWLAVVDHTRVKPKAVVSGSDQAGLATAIQWLKGSGFKFERLPASLHSHVFHFRAGVLRFEDVSIWHGTAFGRKVKDWNDAKEHVFQYGVTYDQALDDGARRRGEETQSSTVIQEFIEKLWERVAPITERYPVS
jgi:hypothetical protein